MAHVTQPITIADIRLPFAAVIVDAEEKQSNLYDMTLSQYDYCIGTIVPQLFGLLCILEIRFSLGWEWGISDK